MRAAYADLLLVAVLGLWAHYGLGVEPLLALVYGMALTALGDLLARDWKVQL